MAIAQGRMSTVAQPADFLEPEGEIFSPTLSHERGPLAVEDTTQGNLFQNWLMTYDGLTGDFILTPEEVGGTVIPLSGVMGVTHLSYTFDQSGRVTIAYSTAVSSYLYWYDTGAGSTVTTDLGADVITPCINLDDKRSRQNAASDMLLWYCKPNGGFFDLYMSRQRDRFLTETLMYPGLADQYVQNVGMHESFRVQLALAGAAPGTRPTLPSELPEPANFDFEAGDVGWSYSDGWSIDQVDPYEGNWSARLSSSGDYDWMECDEFFPVIPGWTVTLNGRYKSSAAQGISVGFAFYKQGYFYAGTHTSVLVGSGGWSVINASIPIKSDVVYVRIIVKSNGQSGTFNVDDFSITI